MKQQDIRSEQLMKQNLELKARDIEELMRQQHKFVTVNCPACDSGDYEKMFVKDKFIFVSCRRCQTVFVNPRPNFSQLAKFYQDSRFSRHWQEEIFPAYEDSRRELIFKPRARRVIEIAAAQKINFGTLVDVGSGYGTFCREIVKLKKFRQVIAIEPSLAASEQQGFTVINRPVEQANLTNIDLVTNFELIEHLFRPQDFLLSCHRLLSGNGLMILTTPNIKGFDLQVLGELSDNIGAPEHLNYFHPASLGLLLARCGYKLIEITTPGRLDAEIVRSKIASGQLKLADNDFLKFLLVDNWEQAGADFQNFLTEHNLSSHLWLVAAKQ